MTVDVGDEPVALMRPSPIAQVPAETGMSGGTRYDVKLDGWRARAAARASGTELHSRKGTRLNSRFPELASALTGALPAGTVLDGEVVAATPDGALDFLALQRTARARRAARLTVLYVAFDVLAAPGGEDVRRLPLDERTALLGDIVAGAGSGGLLQRIATTTSRATALSWMDALPPGMEGIVSKALASRYDPRDRRSWQKTRHSETTDLAVLGITGTVRRPQQVVVLERGQARLTSPRLDTVQARAVLDAVAGLTGTPQPIPGLGADVLVHPLPEGLLAEVRAGSGRHGMLRFVRLRPADV